ncbi:MAG: pyrroloquinoline quinone biosynthesis protein PqqB [Alphaproteobacteria bacterium]
MLRIVVLGAAAGGGFPQWNCNLESSRRARAGDPAARPRTQSSLAVSADGERWFLLNASPDLRQQIDATPELHPRSGKRHSPIAGVVLTNADVDHVAGLLTLRESQPLVVYATPRVQGALRSNSIFNVLNPDFVDRIDLDLGAALELRARDGAASGLVVEAFTVPGKVALWLEDPTAGEDFGTTDEDTIALELSAREGEARFFYIPGCAAMTPALAARLEGAPLVFFDGTLWRDDEMIAAGVGVKTGKRMGHVSMSGADGSIAVFRNLGVARKVFIHVNNTNPALLDDSPERVEVEAAGWEVAHDGMEIRL